MDKILKIQSEIGVLVKTETNPFFKSKYMDINGLLEQLLPLLEKYKLTVVQPLSVVGFTNFSEQKIDSTKPALRTIIYDGEKEILNQAIPLPDLQDPQKMGSAITYYRRYALQSLFLLRAEDDDANTASSSKIGKTASFNAKNKANKEAGVDPFLDEDEIGPGKGENGDYSNMD